MVAEAPKQVDEERCRQRLLEPTTSSACSAPAAPNYRRLREALAASYQRLRGIDGALGLNLPRLFRQVGLIEPDMAFIHPVYLRGELKGLWEYSFLEASPHFIGSGLITEPELKRLSTALAAVAADESISVAQARMPAAWARKPVGDAAHALPAPR
jgi:hypothetical protein